MATPHMAGLLLLGSIRDFDTVRGSDGLDYRIGVH
jgi:hypothetical protein